LGVVIGARAALVRVVRWLLCATAVLTVGAAAARANVFAAVQVRPPGGRSDFDVAVLDASTGVRVPLPAGVNTTADELHPSISADGSRLVFERRDSTAGTVRIIAVDLGTGQSSDLFTGIETSQKPPTSPVITPDGQTVATGGPFEEDGGLSAGATVTKTSLAPFPSGPYTHELDPEHSFGSNGSGEVTDAAAGGDGIFVYRAENPVTAQLCLVGNPGGGDHVLPAIGASTFDDPALAATSPQFVLFVTRGVFSPGDIVFIPLDQTDFGAGPNDSFESFVPTHLPAVVDSPADESQPAVTADGRFIAFVRHGADGHDRLFLWDSQTQLLVNPTGVDLGLIHGALVGSVGLYTKPVFSNGHVIVQASQSAVAAFAARSGVKGILVQRIVGRQRILGRREYRLRMVGRVPLGQFSNGRHRVHWDLRVNGRRLRRGRYLVTLRALSSEGVVLDLAKPDVIRVR
jgi:hypothetical protein